MGEIGIAESLLQHRQNQGSTLGGAAGLSAIDRHAIEGATIDRPQRVSSSAGCYRLP